jgi:hypothetical protein
MMRRVAALFTGLFMLHLTVAADDSACAEHGPVHASHRNSASPVAHVHASHGSHPADGHQHQAPDKKNCDIPVTSRCCEALASCAPNLSASQGTDRSAARESRQSMFAAVRDIPLSVITSPEPPPPKA